MGRSVGIELTDASVKILSLEQNGKKTRLLQFHEAAIPAGEAAWEERAAATLRDALAASKVPRGNVVASIDSGEAVLREVSLPFKAEDQIRRTVRFELESQVHNYTIEQLVVSHFKTGETDKGAMILAAAVPKEIVARTLRVLQQAGVDPVALDLDAAAVYNALRHAGAIASGEPQLLVYGTPRFTKLVLLEERTPRSIRTIRFSMDGGDAKAHAALLDILSREISRFLLASAASATPARILLSGDLENAETARRLEEATKIPVATFNLLDAVDHPFEKPDPARFAAPLGLALKAAGVDPLGMDFRQEEFSYRKRFDAIRTTALVTAELVLVLLGAIALHFHFKRSDLRAAHATVLDYHQKLYEAVTGKTAAPEEAYGLMKAAAAEASGKSADLPIKRSARELWGDFARALESFHRKYANQKLGDGELFLELEQVKVDLVMTPGNESVTFTVSGKIRNAEFAAKLREEIRAVEPFGAAEFLTMQSGAELTQFTLRAHKGQRGG
jgi:hypothetical protein